MKTKLAEDSTIIESASFLNIVKKIQKSDTGVINSFRSEFSEEENELRNRLLKSKLLSSGFAVTAVIGGFIENYGTENAVDVKENIFFVEDIEKRGKLKSMLIVYGEEFYQDSILFIPKGGSESFLIGTSFNDDAFTAYHQERKFNILKFDKGNYEFLNIVKGRPFCFTGDIIIEPFYVGTNNGKFGQSLLGKELTKELLEVTKLKEEGNNDRFEQELSSTLINIKPKQMGVISAYRKYYTLNENRQRNAELMALVVQAGYGYINLEGYYSKENDVKSTSVKEESVLIFGKYNGVDILSNNELRNFLIRIGKKFNQDAIVYINGETATIIGTNDYDEKGNKIINPEVNKIVDIGTWHPNKLSDFYSTMKGTIFIFDNFYITPNSMTLSTIKKREKIEQERIRSIC